MQLQLTGAATYHDPKESFRPLMAHALTGDRICTALGLIYEKDPAEDMMFPFVKADVETGWSGSPREPDGVPGYILERARSVRQAWVDAWGVGITLDRESVLDDLNESSRAGLVLEICRRRGVNVQGLGRMHVSWRLNGTMTGRFGATQCGGSSQSWPNGFNPLTIPKDHRYMVVPSRAGRLIVVIDFKAIDLCSMLALVPGLSARYDDHPDLHQKTAELIFPEGMTALDPPRFREAAKEQIFVHAYGGSSPLKEAFEERLPELTEVRKLPHGEFPRRVQSLSAKAFRAGLSWALPLLAADDVMPMFTVHDELVLDVDEGAIDRALDIANAMQDGASQRIGTRYTTSFGMGLHYASAKDYGSH